MSESLEPGAPRQGSLLRLLPLGVFILLAGLFLLRLFAGDASRLPSALIGRPAPPFALPAVEGIDGVPGFSDDNLREGHVSLAESLTGQYGQRRLENTTAIHVESVVIGHFCFFPFSISFCCLV